MLRVGFVLSCLMLMACNQKKDEKDKNGFSYEHFSKKFQPLTVPYQLSDVTLMRNSDTAVVKTSDVNTFVSDSLRNRLFGKGNKIKYFALAKLQKPKSETYYIVKAVSGYKRAAFLLTFDKNEQFGNVFPFLIEDNDPSTSQISSIDKSYSVARNLIRKKPNGVSVEGKSVYQYDPRIKNFSLIMTDAIDEANQNIINPIDSFSRKQKFSGDYIKDKRNFVSIRDGRHPNQLIAFIHFEQNNGECTGELKGDLLMTSPGTAIYRQGGDPCVLSFRFTPLSVTLREEEGCGSHRGVNCIFEGTFHRKKEPKPKHRTKKYS